MFAGIAWFELRYQLKNPVFWVSALVFFLLVFGSVTVEQIQIGGGGNVHKNSPFALTQTMLVMSLFFMFVSTAFVAGAIVRDDDTGFGPIVRSTRMTKAAYLFGRFTGAFLAGALVLTAVPLGEFAGSLMPWVDPETLGPNRLRDYAFAYFCIGLPGAFLTSALFFALTTATRSMMAAYVGTVVLFMADFAASAALGRKPEFRAIYAWAEPFGLGAVRYLTQYWTPAEQNTLIPPLTGPLLWGRVLWFGVALAALGLAYAIYRFEARGSRRRGIDAVEVPPARAAGPLPAPRHAAARWPQFLARLRLEMTLVFRSPAYAVLLALGMLNAGAGVWFAAETFGTQILPVTRVMVNTLSGAFGLFAVIVSIYYGGELVWRERDQRTNEIIDSTPMPDWAFILPKIIAIAAVLVSTLAISVLAALLVQTIKGYHHYELGKYLWWYIVPNAADFTLIAILSVFVQSLVPAKPIGWGIMLLYLVATITFQNLGFDHDLYSYGLSPTVPLSDMNGSGRFWEGALAFRLYWGAFAVLLMVFAFATWRRGTETRLKPRLARLPGRLKGPAGVVAGLALASFVGLGAWIFHNTNQLEEYRNRTTNRDWQADYEKTLLPYEKVAQPAVAAVRFDIALFPHDRRAVTTGSYTLVNRTAAPIADIHVRSDRDVQLTRVSLAGSHEAQRWPRFNYRILHLSVPMQPGETRKLDFTAERRQRGFRNSGDDLRIVDNGTFLNNSEFAPMIGMNRDGLLTDRAVRRQHGLPADLRMPRLGDEKARAYNYVHADWTTSDITVTTDADQTPIAPGAEVSDVVAGARRTVRFVSTRPILNFFSVQSARYAEKHVKHAGIDLGVYYDRQHPANIDRILRAMGHALDYYQANFAPYQFPYVRVIEFPDYAQFAQGFAGTIPYSEGLGFIADFRDAEKIDYATYVTAHEVGHQWWAHQLVGADMQGTTLLSETLAQYSALMVMEHLYGRDAMRRFLKFELDNYLRSRGSERVEELPLVRVEANQGYIHYRKGSLVMYLLKERMGEAAVNRALRTVLDRYRFKGAPYAMSTELVAALRAEAAPDVQPLITDLLERITIWDLKASDAAVTKRSDGRFDVAFTVTARKLYADGTGKETETPLAEPIDIGLFTAEPGRKAFDAKAVVLFKRVPVVSGRQVLRFVTERAPTWVGVDPYNTHIDRNSDDNLVAVAK